MEYFFISAMGHALGDRRILEKLEGGMERSFEWA
jgi:hypothetical protein